jgi:hypothetical protein
LAANDPGAAVTGAATLPRVVARGENDHLCFLIETRDDGRMRYGRVYDGARDELTQEWRWSAYRAESDYVFPNPRTGRPFDASRYGELLRLALDRAGIEDAIRPSHELRHSSITNAAAAGTSPEALMSRTGHSSYATTRRYIDLAGEGFREEAERLEARLWGGSSGALAEGRHGHVGVDTDSVEGRRGDGPSKPTPDQRERANHGGDANSEHEEAEGSTLVALRVLNGDV